MTYHPMTYHPLMMTYHPMAYHPNDDEVMSMTYHPMIMREIRNYISPAANNKTKERWERLLQKLDFKFWELWHALPAKRTVPPYPPPY